MATSRPGPTETTEFRVRHADGSTRWMEVTGNNLLDDPSVAALVVTARDVTERHVAAELLAVENKVLQLIAELAPLQDVLDTLCLLVESRIRGCVASVWVMDGPERLVKRAAPFAADPRAGNLVSIKAGRMTGNWRDSEQGLGRGRYPYDVNAALVPAALVAAALDRKTE